MAKGNLVNGPIPADKYKSAIKNIKDVLSILKPFEVNLTEEEKKRIPKSGERINSFVEKGLGYMRTNPEFMNAMMDIKEADNDLATQKQAAELTEQVKIVLQVLTDLYIAAGSDAYVASLDYYNSVKRSAERGNATAKQISEDLSKAFKKASGKDNYPHTDGDTPESSVDIDE